MPRNKTSREDVLVTLPDSVVHHISLPCSATGMDCLEKICSLLGIVEVDYFGLRYVDHHGIYLWLNLRMKLTTQLKQSGQPYQLHFRVKYFIDPKTIQQPSTKHLFYLNIKALMLKGQLPIPTKEAPKIGALIAQRELGDSSGLKDKFCYPQYFKAWVPGTARGIAKEHTNLSGLSPQEAESKFLTAAFQLENWGVSYIKVVNVEDNSSVYLGIGGLHIRICNAQWKMIKKISYDYLIEASFQNRIFTIVYRSTNNEGENVEKKLLLRCLHHRITRYLFRQLTEDHTFFSHETVSDRVLDHLRSQPLRDFCEKYFGRKYDHTYHFDVIRTRHEAYCKAWEKLHQVNQQDLNSALSAHNVAIETRAEPTRNHATTTSEIENTSCPNMGSFHSETARSFIEDISHMDLARCGLSKSSCDIAKELLESPQKINKIKPEEEEEEEEEEVDDDDDNGGHFQRSPKSDSVCLTKEGSAKLGKFIQKIVDSKLCRVCMDSPVSAVFCPCGHLISCYKCALECSNCPLCRSPIAYVQYVYGTGL